MIKIVGENGTGKTKKLVQAAAYTNGTIVCKNPDAMIEKMLAYGYTGIKVMSYGEYVTTPVENSYIDDVDKFLEVLGVEGFTLTVD